MKVAVIGSGAAAFAAISTLRARWPDCAVTVFDRDGERLESLPPHRNIHQPLVEDFVVAARQGREPAVTGSDGRETQRVLEAIYAR